MEVVVLLGGKGTRLGNLVEDTPKPMLDVNGKPFLYYLVDLLKKQGFKDFLFLSCHNNEVIKNYFKDGKEFGVNIRHAVDIPYGTGGNLVTDLDKINGDEFILINGDTIFNIDLDLLIKKHKSKKAVNSIALKKVFGADRSGVVELDENEKIVNFSEKKRTREEVLINGGVYILNKKSLENFEKKKFISLEKEIFPKIELYGFEINGKFIDIGTPESYREFCSNPYKYLKIDKFSKKVLKGRVPIRISFGGGGTDVSPYTENYGGVALNVTINKYIFASLKKREDNKIVLISGNEGREESYNSIDDIKLEGEMLPLKAVVKKYYRENGGIELYVYSEVPISSGLGTSASLFVLLISLFNSYNKSLEKDQYEIAEEAYRFEREDLKNYGGRQDQYAAAFGGLNYMEFYKDDFVKVNNLKLNEDIFRELETNLLLFCVGDRVKSGVIEEQKRNLEENKEILEAMHQTKRLAKQMRTLLIGGNLNEFGKKLHEAWEQKKKFSSKITTPYIDGVYQTFRDLGALGGKITGAGGGGHMIIYAPLETHYKIIKKAEDMGIKHIPFKFEKEGLELWIVDE